MKKNKPKNTKLSFLHEIKDQVTAHEIQRAKRQEELN